MRVCGRVLEKYDIPYYTENSGFKGYHLWVFFGSSVPAKTLRDGLLEMYKSVEIVDPGLHYEIFPKQFSAGGSLGHVVKAPFGVHRKTKHPNPIIDLPDEYSKVKFAKIDTFAQLVSPVEAIFKACRPLWDLRETGMHSGHLSHNERLILKYVLLNCGDDGEKELRRILESMDDYIEKQTNYQIEHGKKNNYKPILCRTLQGSDYAICGGNCSNIGKGKSPIAFYWRKMGMHSKEDVLDAFSKFDALEKHGYSYYKRTEKGKLIKLSNFIITVDQDLIIDDGNMQTRKLKGKIQNESKDDDFVISMDDWSKTDKFLAMIYKVIGAQNTEVMSTTDVRDAANKFMDCRKKYVQKLFGYSADLIRYVTPSIIIDRHGIHENTSVEIDLTGEDQAESLNLKLITEEELEDVKRHIKRHLLNFTDHEVTYSAFAHTMFPIVFPFLNGDKSKYVYFLTGSSGTGKTMLMLSMQNFYGKFTKPVTWTSTPNSLQRIGYFFKDSLYLVDDLKRRNLRSYDAVLALLQNYADNTGRSRMKSDATLNVTYDIQGMLAITGEDILTGEASNLARTITVEFNNPKKNTVAGRAIQQKKHLYPGFTAWYIHYILKDVASEEITMIFENYTGKFYELVKNEANDFRIARNVALLMTSFHFVSKFLWNKKEEAKLEEEFLEKYFVGIIRDTVKAARDEAPSERFWNILHELLATGKLRLQGDPTLDLSGRVNANAAIVGFRRKEDTYLMPTLAFTELQKFMGSDKIQHSIGAILSELRKESRVGESTCKKLNGKTVRVVPIFLDEKKLDMEEPDE